MARLAESTRGAILRIEGARSFELREGVGMFFYDGDGARVSMDDITVAKIIDAVQREARGGCDAYLDRQAARLKAGA